MKTNNKLIILITIITLFTSHTLFADCASCNGGCAGGNCDYYGSSETTNVWTGGYIGFGGTTAAPMSENTCSSCVAAYRSCLRTCCSNMPNCNCGYGNYSDYSFQNGVPAPY